MNSAHFSMVSLILVQSIFERKLFTKIGIACGSPSLKQPRPLYLNNGTGAANNKLHHYNFQKHMCCEWNSLNAKWKNNTANWLFCFGRDIDMMTNVMAKMHGKTQINTFQERNIQVLHLTLNVWKKKRNSSLFL